MHRNQSATELTRVLVEPIGHGANVWLRQNITTVEIDLGDGLSQTMWEADEVTGFVGSAITVEEIEDDFDGWWDTFERADMTPDERIAEIYEMAERAQAQADFTAIMTDTYTEVV
ncbi:MAG: hypothetical protein IJ781_04595 [Atopobiaceae bacterium]|nr:hypothetical protein [Atopobiaceae bacterium]